MSLPPHRLSEFFFKKRRFTQFSRIGLTYQLSGTSIEDPEVNSSGDPAAAHPGHLSSAEYHYEPDHGYVCI